MVRRVQLVGPHCQITDRRAGSHFSEGHGVEYSHVARFFGVLNFRQAVSTCSEPGAFLAIL